MVTPSGFANGLVQARWKALFAHSATVDPQGPKTVVKEVACAAIAPEKRHPLDFRGVLDSQDVDGVSRDRPHAMAHFPRCVANNE